MRALLPCVASVTSLLMGCASTPDTRLLAKWHGTWAGTLHMRTPDKGKTETWMELRIAESPQSQDRLRWTIVHGSGKDRETRDYELICTNLERGEFQMDEKNSIVLDMRLFEDALVSPFEIEGRVTVVRYVLRGASIDFMVESFDRVEGRETGGRASVPKVTSHPPAILQRAVLWNPAREHYRHEYDYRFGVGDWLRDPWWY